LGRRAFRQDFDGLRHVEEKKDRITEIFDKYNLRSLAVVDDENVPVGAITVDDVVSRMRAKL